MFKTILIPVLVGSFALCARADGAHTDAADRLVESSQDFESYDFEQPSAKNIHRQAEPGVGGYYWQSPDDVTLVQTRVVLDEETSNLYLDVNAPERPEDALVRTFVPRSSLSSACSNAWVAAEGYSGYYCRFKTKFQLYDSDLRPDTDERDRIVIWAQKDPAGDSFPGRLYVTAGRFTGSLRKVEAFDYRVDAFAVDAGVWHDVVLRAIPDIQDGARVLGFEIWIDGVPALGAVGYSVADCPLSSLPLSDEARVLIAQRRLFPSLAVPGGNNAVSLGGLAFTGVGMVDDISFAIAPPGDWSKAPRVFSLCWDAGVAAISYRVGAGAVVAVPAGEIHTRKAVFEIPSEETGIEVSVVYDTAGDYSQGFWGAEGACSVVTNAGPSYSFLCDASTAPGTGYVRSFRREIGLGGGVGSFASFVDAKEQAIQQGGLVIVLNEDFAAAADTRDGGRIEIARGEELTIDLNGHSLRNSVGEYPTIVNRGKLTIIDSQGGGRVVPYSPFAGDVTDFRQTAVQNYASTKVVPELTIRGGVYDGAINNSGVVRDSGVGVRMEGRLVISRSADVPDDPQFISEGGDEFEFNDYLEDPSLYFAYEEPYWKPLTNAFIWCGKGTDDKWSNPDNWRCNAVPGPSDYAIFPSAGTNVWEADMGTGVAVKDVWFAGNVLLHGSNDCTDVRWKVPSAGRVRGDAVLVWQGRLPPDLSTLLSGDWAGKVVVAGVGNSSPKLLADMASWGTSSSTVRFNGVRGYYHLTSNVTVPWALELVDGADGYAWKNDAGFTGGVVEFPVLLGSGRFVSPRNTIANRQIIIFRDVLSYTGVLEVNGKRVVLGPGVAATLEAGSITWSDGLKIKSGAVHECRVAAFGGAMDVTGSYDTVLANYSDSTVDDSAEVVNLLPGGFTAELCVTNPVGKVKIAHWSENAIIVDGRRVVTNVLETANSLTSIRAPAASSEGLRRLSFARYYTPSVVTNGSMVTLKLALNELAVPVVGATGEESAKVSFSDGIASVVVSEVIEGFWYGLEYKTSLTDEWPDRPYIWTVANPLSGGQVELIAPAEGPSGFYRVVVSDVKPEEGGAE